MISVTDILKLLEQIPIWKAMRELPKRVAELERRLDAMAAGQKAVEPPVAPAKICPICEATMKVTQERPHPQFQFAGVKLHLLECPACGHKTDRMFDPAKGYQ